MTSIVLADAHNVVREGIRALLQSQPDLTVVGEAADGREALNLVEKHHPDMLITDLFMPGLDGLEVVRRVRADYPQTQLMVLSARSDDRYILQALRFGALGYVDKSSTGADLIQAVREVAEGRRYVKPPLSRRVINTYLNKRKPLPLDPYETLTRREREVLYHVINGFTNAEIAKQLSISVTTVATHRAHLMKKLGLHNQTELLHLAAKRGILPSED
ncbi:MAG: response regulator transcription factor [Chloroflexi bacterium]|nr:response regulator transcription factor [Chloroflexota bacterium]